MIKRLPDSDRNRFSLLDQSADLSLLVAVADAVPSPAICGGRRSNWPPSAGTHSGAGIAEPS
ncbi:MAG TPA: hypothetical protein VMV12_07505 [Candidatus Micrarchaeaceae archaeon]|nr:hypothetical protein [Candidatus Micrarchaeaceae archaeon]